MLRVKTDDIQNELNKPIISEIYKDNILRKVDKYYNNYLIIQDFSIDCGTTRRLRLDFDKLDCSYITFMNCSFHDINIEIWGCGDNVSFLWDAKYELYYIGYVSITSIPKRSRPDNFYVNFKFQIDDPSFMNGNKESILILDKSILVELNNPPLDVLTGDLNNVRFLNKAKPIFPKKADILKDHFVQSENGFYFFKRFWGYLNPPKYWNIAVGNILEEDVDRNSNEPCSYGINLGTSDFVMSVPCIGIDDSTYLIEVANEDLVDLIIPYPFDGKVRAARAKIIASKTNSELFASIKSAIRNKKDKSSFLEQEKKLVSYFLTKSE